MQTIYYSAVFRFFVKYKDWFRKLSIASFLIYTVVSLGPVLGWIVEVIRRL
jgi:hypothetical protein